MKNPKKETRDVIAKHVRWTEALRVVRAYHPEVTIILPQEKIQIYLTIDSDFFSKPWRITTILFWMLSLISSVGIAAKAASNWRFLYRTFCLRN